jgi:spermidine/putrescine transport system substrate-binding protein
MLAASLAGGPALLAACSSSSKHAQSDANPAVPSTQLTISNWPYYIDVANGKVDGRGTTVQRFESATGVHVTYHQDLTDNDDYFATIQPVLASGERITADLFVPTFWLAARLLSVGWLERLPLAQVPNAQNLRADLRDPAWDPTGRYTLPWQTGITGIAYNRAVTKRDLTSVNDLFDTAFHGKIGLLDDMRDTVGLVSRGMSLDPGAMTFDDARPVFDKLTRAKQSGQVRRFTGNDYQRDLVAGAFAACIGWSSDVATLALDNDDIRFVVPVEGGMLWADTMAVPKNARHVDAAAKWMNFVYDPANAARITAAVQYVSPVDGVQGELRKLGGRAARLAQSRLLFPDAATLGRLTAFANLSDAEEKKFNDAFAALTVR